MKEEPESMFGRAVDLAEKRLMEFGENDTYREHFSKYQKTIYIA